MPGTLNYSSNNSGGSWWLTDKNWKDLEAAGWKVDWVKDRKDRFGSPDSEGRWLGALATSASREVDDPEEGVAEWSEITGESPSCNCCGEPHSFTFEDAETGKTQYFSTYYGAISSGWE